MTITTIPADLPFIDKADFDARQGLNLVPIDCLDEATRRFADLKKRCMSRLKGCTPPVFVIQARGTYRHVWEIQTEDGKVTRHRDMPAVWVKIEGEQPKLNGWSLAARLERLATGERAVKAVPGVTIPERFRDTGWTCEHCNKDRMRKDCFVVQHEDGTFKQIGASCLRDFLGHNPASLLKFFSNFGALEDEFGNLYSQGFRLPECEDTIELLEYACAAIRVFGWTSKGAAQAYNEKAGDGADKWPTSRYVSTALRASTREASKIRKEMEPTEADKALAAGTLEWVRGWKATQLSDYEMNLSIALKHDIIDPRSTGIAVSAPAAFLRATSRQAELGLKEKITSTSEHRGAEKERLRGLAVTVAYMRYIDTDFGGSTLVKFVADNGDVLTWFASGRCDVKPGDQVKLTGTVKRHTEFNGTKETQLSRCVIDRVAAQAAA